MQIRFRKPCIVLQIRFFVRFSPFRQEECGLFLSHLFECLTSLIFPDHASSGRYVSGNHASFCRYGCSSVFCTLLLLLLYLLQLLRTQDRPLCHYLTIRSLSSICRSTTSPYPAIHRSNSEYRILEFMFRDLATPLRKKENEMISIFTINHSNKARYVNS